jgi:hypothetical protein
LLYDISTQNIPDGYIPEPPPSTEADLASDALTEPTLSSLGLGGVSPVGLYQSALELLHVKAGLPWYGCIALSEHLF